MLHELAAMAEQQIAECAAQIELAEENELLRTKAFVDVLTRVWNREAIIEIALREIAVARGDHRPVGFAIVDIDHFKRVNDCRGHAAGDAVLREISARLRAEIRATDAVGRYGGDEFLIVMPDCTLKASMAASQRIRRAIAAAPIEVEGGEVNVTASFGVAVWQTEAGPIGEVLRAADGALYRAKARGRNRVAAAPRRRDRHDHCQ
jgi:diguanylate cyclase (GGDEF)-like protein